MKKPFLAAILITILLDQLSKHFIVTGLFLPDQPPIMLNDFFSLVMVWNRGVSFGMLASSNQAYSAYLLILVAVVISALLWRAALKTTSRVETIAYGMIIGGALGNAIDRIRYGAVADFLYVHYKDWSWPAFNIADSAICLGVGFLLLHLIKHSKVAP